MFPEMFSERFPEMFNVPWNVQCSLKCSMFPEMFNVPWNVIPWNVQCSLKCSMFPEMFNVPWNVQCSLKLGSTGAVRASPVRPPPTFLLLFSKLHQIMDASAHFGPGGGSQFQG
jgi:hypothetical protein